VRRLSLARSFRLALLGLTLTLAVLAGAGVARLYDARQRYEDHLGEAYALEASAGGLLAAGVVEEATIRTTRGRPGAARARARARTAFDRAAAQTARLAAGDTQSTALVRRAIAAQRALRAGASATNGALAARRAISALVDRQRVRRDQARKVASDATRTAIAVVAIGGVLALLLALGLVSAILAAVRRPLDELVDAAGALASGEPDVHVEERGPGELAELGHAFNQMAGDLTVTRAQLEDERERLRLTIESLGDGLLVTDGDAIEAANPRAGDLFPEAATGTRVSDVPELPDPVEALAGEVVIEHGPRTLAVTAARLGFAGRGLVWTIRDISERARLEQLKSEFVATASHELRSPLTSIKGFIELLSADPALTARQRDFVETVLTSTNRLVDLVNDLLDVTRIEAGRLEIHPRPTDVIEVVHEVTDLLAARLVERDQDLRIDIAPDLPRALADPGRLRQVLTNLLTNAHLYTPEGGQLTVRAAATAGQIVLEVSDTGPGMTAEQVEHAFDRFYRGGHGAASPGTGLGLAIVRSLVDLMGGAIELVSAPGEGTTFTVRLPHAGADADRAARREALAGRKVLVLDDEPEVGELIAQRLEPYGVEAVVESDGEAALERLRAEHFDAITLDILMPGMSGFEVLRALRSDPQLRGLPVVVVSVFSGREALSGEWVVAKPIDADELTDALGAAVLAGRVRVLAVGRDVVRQRAARALDALGIESMWASDSLEVARLCARARFEVALVDGGMPEADRILAALDLRGRRLDRSVVVFSDGTDGIGGLVKLDADPVPVDAAGVAVLALLQQEETPAH
jgi:signal transduction histidine kinase/CheY-like chemotaxis protein